VGVNSRIQVTGGTVGDANNFYADTDYYGGGTLVNRTGLMVIDIRRPVTNQYGVYIDTLTSGSNNYGIYSAGGNNYFAGNVGIGVTNPTGLFQVGGGTLTVLSNGNVGIGTTNPTARLEVIAPGAAVGMRVVPGATYTSFYQGSVEMMRLKQ
jgi:hypothetical protein